jgi:hypothetical protein
VLTHRWPAELPPDPLSALPFFGFFDGSEWKLGD